MRNFRLTIEYDGTNYNGWQIQSSTQRRKGGRVKTIQGVLQKALFKIFSKKITIISCSRTDSGVHAKSHIANFKTSTKLQPIQIKKALNSLLPRDIIVKKSEEVNPAFNAQYDALSKVYKYVIRNQVHVSPFVRNYVYHFRQPLNVSIMKSAAKALLGKHDFAAFKSSAGSREKNNNSIRTIKRLRISKKKEFVEIDVEADGFLYYMVRNIVGTLIEIGRGKFDQDNMGRILKTKNRKIAGPTVSPKGLCLTGVKYGKKAKKYLTSF